MASKGTDRVDLRTGKPIQEYIPGLGSTTIIRQSLSETLLLVESMPDREYDGTVRECLAVWVKHRREQLSVASREVDTVEKLIETIKGQGG